MRSPLGRAFQGPLGHSDADRSRHMVAPLPQDWRVAVPSSETETMHCSRETVSRCVTMFHRESACSSPPCRV